MKLVLFLFLAVAPGFINDIAEINALKEEAREAYISGDYEAAITKYNTLINAYGVQDDEVRLNLAHAQYKNNDLKGAMGNYGQLLTSNDARIRSSAYNQMGLIAHQQKKLKESLAYFKDALKADDRNEEARYNYSVVKEELEQKQEEQQKQKNQDKKQQQDKDKKQQQQEQQQENQQGDSKKEEQQKDKGEKKEEADKKNGEQEKQDQQKPGEQGQEKEQQQGENQEDTEQMPQSTAERLEEMSIPKEKAQMILEAMKNSEIQYLQQNQRKSRSKADSGKPYW